MPGISATAKTCSLPNPARRPAWWKQGLVRGRGGGGSETKQALTIRPKMDVDGQAYLRSSICIGKRRRVASTTPAGRGPVRPPGVKSPCSANGEGDAPAERRSEPVLSRGVGRAAGALIAGGIHYTHQLHLRICENPAAEHGMNGDFSSFFVSVSRDLAHRIAISRTGKRDEIGRRFTNLFIAYMYILRRCSPARHPEQTNPLKQTRV